MGEPVRQCADKLWRQPGALRPGGPVPEPGVPLPLHWAGSYAQQQPQRPKRLGCLVADSREGDGFSTTTMRSWHPRRSLHHLAEWLVDGGCQMHDAGLPVACHAGALVTSEQPVKLLFTCAGLCLLLQPKVPGQQHVPETCIFYPESCS